MIGSITFSTKIITSVLLIVTLALWLGWDIFVANNSEKGDTISEITLAVSYIATFIPAAWRIIMGHLFWPMKEFAHKWERLYAMWAWGGIFLVLNLLKVIPGNMTTIPIIFLVHFVMGHYLWPQKVAPKSE